MVGEGDRHEFGVLACRSFSRFNFVGYQQQQKMRIPLS